MAGSRHGFLFCLFLFFFFNDTATTEIYTLSLHDALPIYSAPAWFSGRPPRRRQSRTRRVDRKSTRLNSSHVASAYAVFCLKKKKTRSEAQSHRQTKKTRIVSKVMYGLR